MATASSFNTYGSQRRYACRSYYRNNYQPSSYDQRDLPSVPESDYQLQDLQHVQFVDANGFYNQRPSTPEVADTSSFDYQQQDLQSVQFVDTNVSYNASPSTPEVADTSTLPHQQQDLQSVHFVDANELYNASPSTPEVAGTSTLNYQQQDLQSLQFASNRQGNLPDQLEDSLALQAFPGPLSRNRTLKMDVIVFCEEQINKVSKTHVDRESAVLMWEYLSLLVRQNGHVAGIDIAGLLVEKITTNTAVPDTGNPGNDLHCSITADRSIVSLPIESALETFRRLCVYGRKKEALDFAIKSQLWQHALFLGMLMGPRQSGRVRAKYVNSLNAEDPLKSMYQVLSNIQPSVGSMVGDETGNWRQHLAVIVNQSTNMDKANKCILSMGDAFARKGLFHSSQLCHLIANREDSVETNKNFVLLGTDPTLPLQDSHATNLSIQMTQILEYAKSLAKPNFCIPTLQKYKCVYMSRLVDAGFHEEALKYCEDLANNILRTPQLYGENLIADVAKFGHHLKWYDPLAQHTEAIWLKNIQAASNSRQFEKCMATTADVPTPADQDNKALKTELQEQKHYAQEHVSMAEYHSLPCSIYTPSAFQGFVEPEDKIVREDLETKWIDMTKGQGEEEKVTNTGPPHMDSETTNLMPNNFSRGKFTAFQGLEEPADKIVREDLEKKWIDRTKGQSEEEKVTNTGPPHMDSETTNLTLNNFSREKFTAFQGLEEPADKSTDEPEIKPKKKAYWPGEDEIYLDERDVSPEKRNPKTGWSWRLLFSWLSFDQAKTSVTVKEMSLPKDTNPSIVWDDLEKKWIDRTKGQGEEEKVTNTGPPPMDSETTNLSPYNFSRGKFRGGKRAKYVDILATSGKAADVTPIFNPMPVPANIFLPASEKAAYVSPIFNPMPVPANIFVPANEKAADVSPIYNPMPVPANFFLPASEKAADVSPIYNPMPVPANIFVPSVPQDGMQPDNMHETQQMYQNDQPAVQAQTVQFFDPSSFPQLINI